MHKVPILDVTTIAIAAICLVVGLIVGSLLSRTLSPQEKKRRELEEKLQAKEDELKIYQRDVSDHLLKTAELVQELNRNQREISEQLTTSAMRLASPQTSRQVQNSAFAGLAPDSRPMTLSSIHQEPPKDYAPSVPGGILSESYGLNDDEKLINVKSVTSGNDDAISTDIDNDDDPTHKIS